MNIHYNFPKRKTTELFSKSPIPTIQQKAELRRCYEWKIHSYVKSLDLSTRRAAPWTLSRLHLEIAGRATQAVKEKDPTWTAGQPVSHEILDEVFAGDTIFQDSINALCSKGSNGLDVKI